MSLPVVEARGVWKRFRRGEPHRRLRDLLPALARGLFGLASATEAERPGEFWALRDVNFRLYAGEALAVLGPNGAGKSTLLRVLTRLLRPERGGIRVRGRLGALIELAAGFHPDLTGRENVFLSGAVLGMPRREVARRLDDIACFAGVERFLDTPVQRYSSGMQARLGFAVAAHLEADVLLVDEVLSVGDAQFQRRCLQRMRERLRQGVAVLFVSHHLPAVLELCPRALVLEGGAVAFDGPAEVATARCLEALDRAGPQGPDAPVELLGWRFDAPDADALRPGDPFALEVRLRFRRALVRPAFHLTVHRACDRLRVCDVAAQQCGLAPRAYAAGEEVTLRLGGRAHLLRGVYALGFYVFLPAEHAYGFCDLGLHTFRVQEAASAGGVADLACTAQEWREPQSHAGRHK